MSVAGTIIGSTPAATTTSYDVERWRRDFPILTQKVNGKPLVYLDNAATSQKPRTVIDRIDRYYREENANIHRGVHLLSEKATEEYEKARVTAQHFLNAAEAREILFVRGTTEAINLVAQTYGRQNFRSGDEIILSTLEHHSNIVPWQMLCEQTGARLKVIPINDAGELLLDEYEKLLGERTKMVAVGHVSNSLGTINPIAEIIQKAHRVGAKVLIDGAQAVPHFPIDVRSLDCDFYAFSGHKVYGPTGIGILYGKAELLQSMPPYQGGGDMISQVTFEKTVYQVIPYKFEAGTPNIAGAIGLGEALSYFKNLDLKAIAEHEHQLLQYATQSLSEIQGLKLVGTASEKASVVSFVLGDIHPHDIGTILDQEGIAIRTGHHCTMPLMIRLGLPATARASMAFYNTRGEIDALVKGIQQVRKVFA